MMTSREYHELFICFGGGAGVPAKQSAGDVFVQGSKRLRIEFDVRSYPPHLHSILSEFDTSVLVCENQRLHRVH